MSQERKYIVNVAYILIPFWLCMGMTPIIALCQDDYQWWNEAVGWDGVSHWNDYLIDSPRFFGPNALTIPAISSAQIRSQSEISFGGALHFTDGDHTQNLKLKWYVPFDNTIVFYGSLIPVEHYSMSNNRRDERRSRDFDGQGFAVGDLILGTQISVLSSHSVIPDILFRSQFKTALGTQRSAARYLDAPAYSFDLNFGKSILFKGLQLRPIAMLGLYVWQTNEDKNPQNDAVLLGIGWQYTDDNFEWIMDYSSYHGYKNNGDHSAAIRNKLTYSFSTTLMIEVSYQYGLYDNLYQTFETALRIQL